MGDGAGHGGSCASAIREASLGAVVALLIAQQVVAEAEALVSGFLGNPGKEGSIPPLVVRADPRRTGRGLRRIAEWCLRFSPVSSVDPVSGQCPPIIKLFSRPG